MQITAGLEITMQCLYYTCMQKMRLVRITQYALTSSYKCVNYVNAPKSIDVSTGLSVRLVTQLPGYDAE